MTSTLYQLYIPQLTNLPAEWQPPLENRMEIVGQSHQNVHASKYADCCNWY